MSVRPRNGILQWTCLNCEEVEKRVAFKNANITASQANPGEARTEPLVVTEEMVESGALSMHFTHGSNGVCRENAPLKSCGNMKHYRNVARKTLEAAINKGRQ
jgi:hypothetical protein